MHGVFHASMQAWPSTLPGTPNGSHMPTMVFPTYLPLSVGNAPMSWFQFLEVLYTFLDPDYQPFRLTFFSLALAWLLIQHSANSACMGPDSYR